MVDLVHLESKSKKKRKVVQMCSMSRIATNALRTAGYYPGRRTDLAIFNARLEEFGFEVFPCVLEFMEKYGDLIISPSNLRPINLSIDFISRHAQYDDRIRDDYSRRVQKKLCPVGEWSTHILTMTPEGEIYGSSDEFLMFMGNSGEDAIDQLCNNDQSKFKVISEFE